MKKILALLLTGMLVLSLVACSGGGQTSGDAEPAEEPAAATGTFEKGLKGTGEETLSCMFCDMTVPAGYNYEVYFYSVNEGEHTGTMQLDMGKTTTLDARLEVSTTRMISSLQDACDECIATKNLGTYENGSSAELGEATYGGQTYKILQTETEYGQDVYLVTYMKLHDKDVFVELHLDPKKMTQDDPFVASFLNSIKWK